MARVDSGIAATSLDTNDPPTSPASNHSSTASSPPSGNGGAAAGIIMFLIAATAAAACLWVIKRRKARRRRREYMASARKVSQAQEALDLDKPPTSGNKEEDENDDDVILQNVNQVFERPPLQLKESSAGVSFGDRLVNSVSHLFGSKVPLGAARVRTTTGGADAAAAVNGGAEENATPIVINGRIQALYDEIMKNDQPKPGDYGILQEEVTPESARRRSARKSASFRPASELSAVSEVSLELMDQQISTELMDRGKIAGDSSVGYDHQSHIALILGQDQRRPNVDGLDSVGLDSVGLDSLGLDSLGLDDVVGDGGGLADELESSLPSTAEEVAGGTEISSTGFIADKQSPNKYYSIAYTEYYLDD